MNRNVTTAAIAALLLSSTLLNAQTIYKKEDKFDGDAEFFTEIKNVDVEGGSFWSGTYVYFSLHGFRRTADSSRPFLLRVKTQTDNWIFISKGASLHLKIDGSKMMQLAGDGSIRNREVLSGPRLEEVAFYYLTLDELKRIAQAKTIDFRVFGDRKLVTGTLTPEFIADAVIFAKDGPALLGISEQVASVPLIPSSNAAGLNAGVSSSPAPNPQQGSRLRLGVNFVDLPPMVAAAMGRPDYKGALIMLVESGSVAESAGIKLGDVLFEFDGSVIASARDLQAAVAAIPVGKLVPIKVLRALNEVSLRASF